MNDDEVFFERLEKFLLTTQRVCLVIIAVASSYLAYLGYVFLTGGMR